MMKFSWAISWVNWLSGGFLTTQPIDPADSPRKLHHTQLPGKQQISLPDFLMFIFARFDTRYFTRPNSTSNRTVQTVVQYSILNVSKYNYAYLI
jgi:hypothetical protein